MKWVVLVLALGALSCSAPVEKEDDDLVGAPPPPSEDPFYFAAMPAEAVPVAARGMIAPEEKAPEAPEVRPEIAAKVSPEIAAKVVPEVAPKVIPPRPVDESTQCFSCVKICPVEGGVVVCPARDDLVCGWGVHPQAEIAGRLAQAECDGALNLIRDGKRWSAIEGTCPPASCE